MVVIVEAGPYRVEVADVEWTTFDTEYTTLGDLEERMARSFVTCNGCLDLVTLIGDPAIGRHLQETARRLYARHVPDAAAIDELRGQLHAVAHRIGVARGHGDVVGGALDGGALVWLAGRILLGLAGIGPVREDGWHDALAAASLPFDAATPYARWHVGGELGERLEAALTLAEGALGEPLPRAPIFGEPAPRPPALAPRPAPDAAEAVEMHRLVAAVGFGKMAKADGLGDEVRQASEAGVILWFAVPALLAIGGSAAPDQRWWDHALRQAAPPGDIAALHARALTDAPFAARKVAAIEVGRIALDTLETIFRGTPYADKYRRRIPL